jgi:hypothetical protein
LFDLTHGGHVDSRLGGLGVFTTPKGGDSFRLSVKLDTALAIEINVALD